MPHDANFVDNRLRLATFLRLVQHGMPQRPARLKRRHPATCEQSQAPGATPTNQHHPLITAKVGDKVASLDSTGVDGLSPESQHDATENQCPSQRCASPAPDEQLTSTRTSAPKSVLRKVNDVSSSYTSTRRRRLPVMGLALHRTTTTDGLPEPEDAKEVFADPSTTHDPIHIKQAVSPIVRSQERVLSKLNLSPRKAPRAHQDNNKMPQMGSATLFLKSRKSLPALRYAKQHVSSGFETASDGFVGTELNLTSTRRTARRKGAVSTKGENITVVPELALGSGPLPDPPVLTAGTSVSLQHGATRYYPNMPAPSNPEPSEDAVEILPLATTERTAQDNTQKVSPSQQWESVMRSKLSNVTAPMRSESSDSENDDDDEHSAVEGEEEGADDADEDGGYVNLISHSNFVPLARTLTFAMETDYFGSAMQHLDAADTTEVVDEECWS